MESLQAENASLRAQLQSLRDKNAAILNMDDEEIASLNAQIIQLQAERRQVEEERQKEADSAQAYRQEAEARIQAQTQQLNQLLTAHGTVLSEVQSANAALQQLADAKAQIAGLQVQLDAAQQQHAKDREHLQQQHSGLQTQLLTKLAAAREQRDEAQQQLKQQTTEVTQLQQKLCVLEEKYKQAQQLVQLKDAAIAEVKQRLLAQAALQVPGQQGGNASTANAGQPPTSLGAKQGQATQQPAAPSTNVPATHAVTHLKQEHINLPPAPAATGAAAGTTGAAAAAATAAPAGGDEAAGQHAGQKRAADNVESGRATKQARASSPPSLPSNPPAPLPSASKLSLFNQVIVIDEHTGLFKGSACIRLAFQLLAERKDDTRLPCGMTRSVLEETLLKRVGDEYNERGRMSLLCPALLDTGLVRLVPPPEDSSDRQPWLQLQAQSVFNRYEGIRTSLYSRGPRQPLR